MQNTQSPYLRDLRYRIFLFNLNKIATKVYFEQILEPRFRKIASQADNIIVDFKLINKTLLRDKY